MRQQGPTRKARFRAALALADITAKEWCEREGYSENHLYLYLRGDRESMPLTEKMDAFISEHLSAHAA
jgi:hypothetical protein